LTSWGWLDIFWWIYILFLNMVRSHILLPMCPLGLI
jgi:hypothetical protein